jgi:2-methylisocitrate lyase-like PEP mutase family enzyme
MSVQEKRARFRALHERGCFVLPNPWDVGSARLLQHLGFSALASTSSGFAWTTGRPDYAVGLSDVLGHLTTLCAAVDIPVNADFESGFASEPERLAENVRLAVATGVAGLSVEDRVVGEVARLYDASASVERIRAARGAIDRSGEDVVLVARTEGLLIDPSAIGPAIDKLVAFAEAGADCLYAPGVKAKADIAAMVRAVAPKPLNVLVMGADLSVGDLAELGVRRISVGGALARVAWSAMLGAAEQMKAGSFGGLAGGQSGGKLNDIFGGFVRSQ